MCFDVVVSNTIPKISKRRYLLEGGTWGRYWDYCGLSEKPLYLVSFQGRSQYRYLSVPGSASAGEEHAHQHRDR